MLIKQITQNCLCRSVNAIFGKIDKVAYEEVVVYLEQYT